MALRRFARKKKKGASGDVALNITAMADIFTIILVFLLKSFSTSAVSVAPGEGLQLANADAPSPEYEALKIEVSETAVLVEGAPAAKLEGFRFAPSDLGPNRVSRTLGAALEKERKRQMLIAQANPDVKVDSKVMVIADKRTPYSTLKSVLAAAAVSGYTDFKMVVARPE